MGPATASASGRPGDGTFMTPTESSQPPPDESRVLIVDDEKVIREILADFLTLEGFRVSTAQDGMAALEILDGNHFDMVISDLKMPNMGGLELLENIQNHHENVLTVIMTGFGTVETAIEAMKKGAYDYILKPFKVEEVVHIVHRGIEKQRLISENIRLKEIISLHELSEQLQVSLSLDEVVDSTLQNTLRNIAADIAWIHLKDDENDEMAPHGHLVAPDAPPRVAEGRLSVDRILGELEEKRSVIAQAPSAEGYFLLVPEGLSAFMCVPLVTRQKTLGLLSAYSCTAGVRFAEGQRKLMSMLGSRAAAAIDNAALYANLQQTFRQTISEKLVAGWFRDRKPGRRPSYAQHLSRFLSAKEIETVHKLLVSSLQDKTVPWRSNVAFLKARKPT